MNAARTTGANIWIRSVEHAYTSKDTDRVVKGKSDDDMDRDAVGILLRVCVCPWIGAASRGQTAPACSLFGVMTESQDSNWIWLRLSVSVAAPDVTSGTLSRLRERRLVRKSIACG